MLFFRGGNHVAKGHYWAPANGSWVDGGREHLLPGAHDTVYLRVHPVAMFLLAPAIGLAYFLTLPLIAIVFAAAAVLTRIARELAHSLGALAYFEWRPNEAYLAGKGRKDKGQGTNPKESH